MPALGAPDGGGVAFLGLPPLLIDIRSSLSLFCVKSIILLLIFFDKKNTYIYYTKKEKAHK